MTRTRLRFTATLLAALLLSAAMATPAFAQRAHVIGGQTASSGQFPYAAEVFTSGGLCSGTVVSADVVLTAGHCAVNETTGAVNDPSAYAVKTEDPSTGYWQTTAVTQIVPDPSFTLVPLPGGEIADSDVALLQLSAPVAAPPVALASADDQSLYAAGAPATIMGWGLTAPLNDGGSPSQTLQYAPLSVQPAATCSNIEASWGIPGNYPDQLCAQGSGTTGTCSGDSGGPLIAQSAAGPMEIGVTSWNSDDCNPADPDFFANVAALSPWLTQEIAALTPPVTPPSAPSAGSSPTSASSPAASSRAGAKAAASLTLTRVCVTTKRGSRRAATRCQRPAATIRITRATTRVVLGGRTPARRSTIYLASGVLSPTPEPSAKATRSGVWRMSFRPHAGRYELICDTLTSVVRIRFELRPPLRSVHVHQPKRPAAALRDAGVPPWGRSAVSEPLLARTAQ